ncbi:MAG TPA: anti-sigma factor [Candidatus Dormibacteraeota bacterium]|nr:anti-sigma factor [Candidatus Dormibacteraeota bacterium]
MSEEEELENRVLEALALGVDPVQPPAGLRERILAEAAAPGRVVPLRRAPFGRRLPIGAVAAAVAVALLAGLVIGRTTAPAPPPVVAHFTISGHGPFQGVTAKVVDLKSEGVALVTFDNMPAPPAGQVYELWLITPGGKADPAGVFVPDASGSKVLVVGQSLAGYHLMAVTVEAGPDGVGAPTQQPQIYGTVA